MVYLVKKTIKGQIYLYLVESARVNGKVKRVWQKYLGPEKEIKSNLSFALSPKMNIVSYDFGLPVALMQIVEKLDLIAIVNRATHKRAQGLSVGHYIAIAALNRCVKPLSKNRILGWFETTYLRKFFPAIETYLDSMAYSNHFKYLTEEAIARVQTELNRVLIAKFGVSMDQLIYDPTNFFTYINPDEDVELPRHGHSKENRATLNLVGSALLCTQDGGIPLLYDVYPGNIQDAALFKDELPKILERIGELQRDSKEIVLLFDKGNNSPEIFALIDAAKVMFVSSLRPSMVKDLAPLSNDHFTMISLPNGKLVGFREYVREFYGRSRRLIAMYNPEQAKWNGKNLREKLERDLQTVNEFFRDRLNMKKWRSIDAVRKKISALIPVPHWAWLTLELTEQNGAIAFKLAINEDKLNQHLVTLGKSYVITNHPSKSAEEIIWSFRRQGTIEKAFTYLKSPDLLRARPIFHRTDPSVRGHLFSCVIGLLLLTLLAREVHKTFPQMSLMSILEHLSTITVSAIKVEGQKKIAKHFNAMSIEAEKLATLLNLPSLI